MKDVIQEYILRTEDPIYLHGMLTEEERRTETVAFPIRHGDKCPGLIGFLIFILHNLIGISPQSDFQPFQNLMNRCLCPQY